VTSMSMSTAPCTGAIIMQFPRSNTIHMTYYVNRSATFGASFSPERLERVFQ